MEPVVLIASLTRVVTKPCNMPPELHTPRLILRTWHPEDAEPLAVMHADAEVMAHFPAPLTRAQSDALMERCQSGLNERGWGLWAAQRRDTGDFVGLVGLNVPGFALPFSAGPQPPVEVAWRLARAHWGQGLATEAARAVMAWGFERLALSQIIAFTSLGNLRSQAVMARLGMTRGGDFEHPLLPPGHVLRAHGWWWQRAEDLG